MKRDTKIIIIAGILTGFVAALIMAPDPLPEIQPEFEDSEFIENLSNYE